MAQYTVLRPIEYNGKLYVPKSEDAPASTRSGGNGIDIPVDRSGLIELTVQQATEMTLGQIQLIKSKVESQKSKAKAEKE